MSKEKLLRIRPFNMANFSGTVGYMPIYALFAMIASFPATFFVWAGIAGSLKKEDGSMEYQILKRRLNRILLPICIIAFVLCFIPFSFNVLDYGGSLAAYWPAIAWGAGVPTVGIYCVLLFTARRLNGRGLLFKMKWLKWVLISSALMLVIAFFVLILFIVPLGDFFNGLWRDLS